MKNNKIKYIYLVYCNPEYPLVYSVFSNYQKARDYAEKLINYRRDRCKERNWDFGFYHYSVLRPQPKNINHSRKDILFSACLKIKDNLPSWSEDGCYIKVERQILN